MEKRSLYLNNNQQHAQDNRELGRLLANSESTTHIQYVHTVITNRHNRWHELCSNIFGIER